MNMRNNRSEILKEIFKEEIYKYEGWSSKYIYYSENRKAAFMPGVLSENYKDNEIFKYRCDLDGVVSFDRICLGELVTHLSDEERKKFVLVMHELEFQN